MKKSLYFIVVLPLLLALAGCSSLKLPGSAQPAAASQSSQSSRGQGGFANFANQPVENKLAIGTLKLEGTPNAVNKQEAEQLLPLWKAVKSLSTSNTTSSDEIQALYQQIESTMTPAQVQAIKALTLQQSDMQALMQQYGVQQGAFGGGTPSAQQATRIAQFRAQGGGNGTGGTGGAGNGTRNFGTGGGGNFGGGNFGANATRQPNAQRTPQPGRRNLGGLNYLFVDPVIKLLQQRAG